MAPPRYICHCYDIMENLAASRNATRLVIKCDLTGSEDKHDILGVRVSRYYYIFGSIDSKQMVKVFSHKKKHILVIFLNFYRKSKQKFWNRSYLTMVKKRLELYLYKFYKLLHCDQKYIYASLNQAYYGLT